MLTKMAKAFAEKPSALRGCGRRSYAFRIAHFYACGAPWPFRNAESWRTCRKSRNDPRLYAFRDASYHDLRITVGGVEIAGLGFSRRP